MNNHTAEPQSRPPSREGPGDNPSGVQVKICGLTKVEDALECAFCGADAVGLVFYPPSPRFVKDETAREICQSLPRHVWSVGVFVNEPFETVMGKVEQCGLRAVQLHGAEPPRVVDLLRAEGVSVIKTLFINGSPPVGEAAAYPASAYLVESGGGRLPGGNAMAWDWKAAKGIFNTRPFILAGGLDSENVAAAIAEAAPDAVDVSSGVESSPGQKDMAKVKTFLEAVRGAPGARRGAVSGRIFQ